MPLLSQRGLKLADHEQHGGMEKKGRMDQCIFLSLSLLVQCEMKNNSKSSPILMKHIHPPPPSPSLAAKLRKDIT